MHAIYKKRIDVRVSKKVAAYNAWELKGIKKWKTSYKSKENRNFGKLM